MNFHQLSIIVPVRNEERSIDQVLLKLAQVLPGAEVIVVDGGKDETFKIVERWIDRASNIFYVKNSPDFGKGHAIRVGIAKASRKFIAQFDADLQFSAEDLVPMLSLLEADRVDFICGSRFLFGSQRESQSVPGPRSWGNRAISFYSSLFVGQKLTDVLAGIKMWKREVTDQFYLRCNHFCYEVELPIKALRCGYRVMDYPVQTHARRFGQSSVNVWKTGFQLLKEIPRCRWESLSPR